MLEAQVSEQAGAGKYARTGQGKRYPITRGAVRDVDL